MFNCLYILLQSNEQLLGKRYASEIDLLVGRNYRHINSVPCGSSEGCSLPEEVSLANFSILHRGDLSPGVVDGVLCQLLICVNRAIFSIGGGTEDLCVHRNWYSHCGITFSFFLWILLFVSLCFNIVFITTFSCNYNVYFVIF